MEEGNCEDRDDKGGGPFSTELSSNFSQQLLSTKPVFVLVLKRQRKHHGKFAYK